MDFISKIRVTFFDLVLKNIDTKLNMDYLGKKYNIDPVALFVAEYDETRIHGPLGGQMLTYDKNFEDELSLYKDTLISYVNFKFKIYF